jgi:hypothetical protein
MQSLVLCMNGIEAMPADFQSRKLDVTCTGLSCQGMRHSARFKASGTISPVHMKHEQTGMKLE